MVLHGLHCRHCPGTAMVRQGMTRHGPPRSRCRACPEHGRPVRLASAAPGQAPDLTRPIVERALQASGIRETARVRHVRPTTGIQA
jgi:insertion element IS1 protein InsB